MKVDTAVDLVIKYVSDELNLSSDMLLKHAWMLFEMNPDTMRDIVLSSVNFVVENYGASTLDVVAELYNRGLWR